MQYFVSFTLFLDQKELMSKEDLKNLIKDNLDSAGASVENIETQVIKHI